jgi:hypothetical protein
MHYDHKAQLWVSGIQDLIKYALKQCADKQTQTRSYTHNNI